MNQRWITASVAGAALATGGALLGRSTRRALGPRNEQAAVPYGHGHRIEKFATIAREPGDVYAAWRDLASLSLVMPNVKRVEDDGAHSRWTVAGPGKTSITWDAEILVDRPGERISWRADEAPVKHAGTVRFEPAPGGRGTEVTVEIEYVPPAGPIGALAGKIAQAPPQRLVEIDLRRFKSVLEAGDIAVNGTDVTE
jgi:uncharacterized membrane protein